MPNSTSGGSCANTGIDALMISGRWAEMARVYSVKGRFIDKPNFVHFPAEKH